MSEQGETLLLPSSDHEGGSKQLLPSTNSKPPPERFEVLLLFSLLSLSQASAWNFFGPISGPCEDVYGWGGSTIAWLANAANIAMLFSVPMSSKAAIRFGLRGATCGCTVLVVVCTVLRIIPIWLRLPMKGPAVLTIHVISMIADGLAAAWVNWAC